jgi:hypothetical protein
VIDRLIDRLDAFATRWSLPLAVMSTAWFVASCAEYAGFVDMPALIPIDGWAQILPAAVWNFVWWGFVFPRVHGRRAHRASTDMANG